MVSVHAFNSDNTRSHSDNFLVKLVFEKNENKQKEAGVGPFKNNLASFEWEVIWQVSSSLDRSILEVHDSAIKLLPL